MHTLINRHIPKYGVFIIESMDIKNEREGNLNGFVLKTILDLCGIPNEYFYLRTKPEFENIIEEFEKSDYGFLHISCHANNECLELTYDSIEFHELDMIMGRQMKYRRLFLSACEAAVFDLAKYFIPRHHAYSIIGSPDTIEYDKAAVFWSSFYYLMYGINQKQMWQTDIMPILQSITKTFSLKLNYFSIIGERNRKSKTHLREIHFHEGEKVFDETLNTGLINLYRDPPGIGEDFPIVNTPNS